MLTTVHLFTGAAVAVVLQEPLIALPTAFVTHYILDAIPHFAFKPVKGFKKGGFKGASKIDLIGKAIEPIIGITALAVIVFFVLPENLRVVAILGAFVGWLPDFLVFLEWKYDIKRPQPLRAIEQKTHKHTGGLKGVVPQLLVLAVSCLLLCL